MHIINYRTIQQCCNNKYGYAYLPLYIRIFIIAFLIVLFFISVLHTMPVADSACFLILFRYYVPHLVINAIALQCAIHEPPIKLGEERSQPD